MLIPAPPALEDLQDGHKLVAGMGHSTVIPDIDFETYSAAGFIWHPGLEKFKKPPHSQKKGLPTIGAAAYSEHHSTEVLSMAYNLKDGEGSYLWKPGDPPPFRLFSHIAYGGLLEAWNVTFERWIWNNVCIKKYGFPAMPREQWRDALAKSRAFALPGGLAIVGRILNIKNEKEADGKRLIKKFSMPRDPTRKDKRTRILPKDDPQDAKNLYDYNLRDIVAEAEISSLLPDLIPTELNFWLCDQEINSRGVQLDIVAIKNCIAIVEQAHDKYNKELRLLTNNRVQSASEVQKLRKWLMECCVSAPALDAETVAELLSIESLNPSVRRVLEIRQIIGSAAVKKLYSMLNQVTQDGRVHDLFIYHAARTGRAAGAGPQPQNLPNSGPAVSNCALCSRYSINRYSCMWCGSLIISRSDSEWNTNAVNDALETIATGNLECVEYHWGNAIDVVSGCLRGLFISKPGYDLICSDYSAIEAVVLAELAGEEWRQEVFRTHGKIYELSASKITGIPFEEFLAYKQETGQHHIMRKKVGKIAELASGFGGWIGAWKAFGADQYFTDEEINQAILAWRKASPAIVEFWGGQQRNWLPEFYGLEGAAVQAVLSPGTKFSYRGLSYLVRGDILYCELLSGRYLVYHQPRVSPSTRRPGTLSLSFHGWNTNPKYGAVGWVQMETYGGKLTENVVQATARDILAHAIVNLERSGYSVVLHVHDEIVSEIPENWGSIDEFEQKMSSLPYWAEGWPVKASGGWRAKRYAK